MTWREMREYLHYLMSYYSIYHNHKEISAWAAVIIFIIISLQIPTVISTQVLFATWFRFLCTFSFLVILIAILIFIYKQEDLKRRSSYIFSACALVETENLKRSNSDPVEDSYKTDPRGSGKYQWDYFLPAFIMDKADSFGNTGGKTGKTLEFIKYLLLIILTGIAIVRIWWPS